MSSSIATLLKLLRAFNARRKHLKLQNTPTSPAFAKLTKPNVVGIVDPNDGTLHTGRLKSNLIVEIPEWAFLPGDDPNDFITLQLQYTRSVVEDNFVAIGPAEDHYAPLVPEDFPLILEFPQNSIPLLGTLRIRYHLIDHLADEYVSDAITLICDGIAPWGNDPAPPLIPPSTIINEAYLQANPGGIELSLPDYLDRQSSDTYHVFYLKDWTEDNDQYENPVAAGSVGNDLKVIVPTEAVRLMGDGRYYIVYYLFDKARNRSRIRLPTIVDVVLTPEPADLAAPRVPLAEDDQVLSLEDAQAGVSVVIPQYTNYRQDDRIVVTWGTQVLPWEQLGTRPFPVSIVVPNTVLHEEYGKASAGVLTDVSYRVLRGEAPYGPRNVEITVDFSVAGPERPDPDPDWPNPVNPRLGNPEIISSSGLVNEIAPPDRDKDATLEFEVFEGAEDGQIVDFYWGGTLVSEVRWEVDLGTGEQKTVTIPWRYIEAAGNNLALPVHYTVRASLEPINEQESLTTYVNVTAIDMTPDDLEFHGVTSRGWLTCSSIRDPANPTAAPAIRVKVPSCSRFGIAPGTTITLSWQVYDAHTGGSPIPGDDVPLSQTFTLTAEQIENGFDWRVEPYATHILPLFDELNPQAPRRAEVSYVINTTPPMQSNPTGNKISLADQSTGSSCDLQLPRQDQAHPCAAMLAEILAKYLPRDR